LLDGLERIEFGELSARQVVQRSDALSDALRLGRRRAQHGQPRRPSAGSRTGGVVTIAMVIVEAFFNTGTSYAVQRDFGAV
jgi:hypothetical protein